MTDILKVKVNNNWVGIPAIKGEPGEVQADLSNLSQAGKDKLYALKAHADKGEVLTDSEGLSAIKEYYRSTFDISKFTKAGSPTVTNDGIITFGDSSNYLQADFDFTQNHVFEIEFSGNNSTATTYRPINNGYQIYINPNNANRMLLYAQSGNAGFLTTISNTAFSSNYTIKLKITKNNLTYTIDYLINGTISGTETVTLQSTPATESNIRFYALDTQHSVNLKSVSITTNGQEVFNGNKSGIDIIKADDYTVVGSPTITNDGIASGFSNSNYLTKNFNFSSESLKIRASFKTGTFDSTTQLIFESLNVKMRLLWVSASSAFYLSAYFSDGTNSTQPRNSNIAIQPNTEYIGEIELIKGVSARVTLYDKNGNLLENSKTSAGATTTIVLPDATATSYIGYSINNYFTGSIDLNQVKIYVNGNLAYQPCLKIPYNKSKAGSKIVSEYYRDRVEDMYSQFGWANYYTLLEERKPHYTVVGSPTISSDYVASGFSSSNYLKTITLDTSKNFEIYCMVTSGSNTANKNTIMAIEGSGRLFALNIQNNKFGIFASSDGTNWTINGTQIGNVTANTNYYLKVKTYNGTFSIEQYENNTWNSLYNETFTLHSETGRYLILGVERGHSEPFLGTIDLKQFKIYVDNKLVYQAVEEPDFTLPMGENLDGHVTKVDWYKNGTTSWEYDTNLDCTQTGSCTSGTAVTFAKAFADTNYTLSVPYSAKSKTGFTSSQTGDYIAKGKVVLG